MILDLSPGVTWTLAGILALLVVGSVAVRVVGRRRDVSELAARVRTWWAMVAVFSVAVLLGRGLSIAFLAFVSFLALKEYLSLIPTRRADRRVLFMCYLAIPIQYLWVAKGWYGMFIVFIPVYVFLFLPFRMVTIGETKGFLGALATLHWGLMTTVFSLSHAAFLLVLPEERNPAGGGPGLLLFLVVLTQLGDVSQYVWGKSVGRIKVAPKVSPGKTLGGVIGGVGTVALLAWLLGPHLTPLPPLQAACAGLLIGFAGFAGDLSISALKRDLGIKDSGSMLPGHGGILDRVDSLTYTAPLFFHYVYYFQY